MALTLVNPAAITVTTAGTRVQAASTVGAVYNIYIEALGTNTGYIYVGLSTVSSARYITRLSAGQGTTIEGVLFRGNAEEILLSDMWIDSSVNGEKALLTYMVRS